MRDDAWESMLTSTLERFSREQAAHEELCRRFDALSQLATDMHNAGLLDWADRLDRITRGRHDCAV